MRSYCLDRKDAGCPIAWPEPSRRVSLFLRDMGMECIETWATCQRHNPSRVPVIPSRASSPARACPKLAEGYLATKQDMSNSDQMKQFLEIVTATSKTKLLISFQIP
jgi:hypothetical protein